MPVSPRFFILATFAAGSVLAAGLARAEDLTSDQIRRALMPPLTRSLSPRVPTDVQVKDAAFVETLRQKPGAALSVDDRAKLDAVADSKPAVDLSMEFATNSAELRGPALATATKLGEAISAPELKDKTFLIAGYTDAKGPDLANQKLSERRADAVKAFLIKTYHVNPANLITVGYGKTKLKNPASPFGPENRRVQTVNILPFKSAGN